MLSLALLLVIAGAPASAGLEGRSLLERFECHRCHEGTNLAPMSESRHCVRCHEAIASGRFEASADTLARWRKNLTSLPAVPSLEGVGRVLQRGWVERFLLEPIDLRPHLPATMPRLSLGPKEAAALATLLVPEEADGPPPSRTLVDEGRAAFRRLRCADCHQFTGSGEVLRADSPYRGARPANQPSPPSLLAPDLRFVRERFQAGALVSWIQKPAALRPHTLMPALVMTKDEAEALAAFVWHAPLDGELTVKPEVKRATLERKVSYAEVEARVFRKVCWHCHSSPDYNLGDGGPGNTGGFGFAGRDLDLSSYQSIAAGMLGGDGERQSVFAPTGDGVPRLLAVLLARRAEERGEIIEGVRGMPLGLPSLSDEEIQLVESWIAQGRPR